MAAVKGKNNQAGQEKQTKINFTPIILQQGKDIELSSTETKAGGFLRAGLGEMWAVCVC